jgi:hypothetical protein
MENIWDQKHASRRSELKTIFVLSGMDNFKLSHIKFGVLILFYLCVSQLLFAQNDSTSVKKLFENSNKTGFPVLGIQGDTLFFVYSRLGASSPQERAFHISDKIKRIYENDNFQIDSLIIAEAENSYDLIYGEMIVTTVTPADASYYNMELIDLAAELKEKISMSLIEAKEEQKFFKILIRSLLALLVFGFAAFIYWLLGKLYSRILKHLEINKNKWLKNLAYKEYTFLTAEQELGIIHFILRVIRIFLFVILIYFTLSIAFSIFPFTRGWADRLFQLVW